MIKAIIFDMDGVLIDSETYYFKCFLEMMKNDGKEVDVEDFKKIVGKSHNDSLAMVGEYYDENFDGEEFLKKFDKTYREKGFNYKDILFPYVTPLLNELKNRGYRLAVASSSYKKVIETALNECEIKDYFEVISSGEDFEESKPNPEIYLTTAKKLGLNPEECLAVEDSSYGIKAAKLAGMKVVAKKDYEFNINQDRADFILNDLAGIIGVLDILKQNKTNYNYYIFNYGSKKYVKSLFLRNNGLRTEFGLSIFKENLEDEKNDLHIGIFDEDNIVASLVISDVEGENLARLKSIVVDENYRGKSIGKMIMDSGALICKSLGYKKTFVKARKRVKDFYEKSGYKIVSEEYDLPPTNIPHYDMIKVL